MCDVTYDVAMRPDCNDPAFFFLVLPASRVWSYPESAVVLLGNCLHFLPELRPVAFGARVHCYPGLHTLPLCAPKD